MTARQLVSILPVSLLLACPGRNANDDDVGDTATETDTGSTTDTDESTSTDTSSSEESTDTGSSDSTDTTEGETTETGDPDPLPDIDMTLVTDVIAESAYTQTLEFSPNDCAVEEQCVIEPGTRRLLRFSTYTPNVGTADMIVGSPQLNPEDFEWGECHGHYHFSKNAAYRLLDGEGNEVATGHKQAFALIDFEVFSQDAGPGKYPLMDGTQGISMGWQDIYDAHLDCQWVDITGVASGDYQLEISINYEQVIEELSYGNNLITIPVTITDIDDGPTMPPPEWSCDPNFYDTDDGCDCGCGAFDPDCPNPTSQVCQYCDNQGSCSENLGCGAINPNDNSTCQ
jgi:Lysyl oxidase